MFRPIKITDLTIYRGLRFLSSRFDSAASKYSNHLVEIPSKYLEEIFPNIDNVSVVLYPSTNKYGNVSTYELYVICAIAKYIDSDRIFEIGTFNGSTTYNLALNTNAQTAIFTLDLPQKLVSEQSDKQIVHEYEQGFVVNKFKGTPQEQKITQLYGDSTTFDFSSFLDSMNLIFIDGGHTYECVKSDTVNALKLLSKNKNQQACVIWRDFDIGSDVMRVVEELSLPCSGTKDTRMAIYIPG
jgi:predicted O-methyltransferase YrrM